MRKALSILVVAALMAAACGSDDSDGAALTQQEWIAAADAICVEFNEELAPIPEPQSAEEMGETGAQVLEIWRAGMTDLRALEAPEGQEATVEEILVAFEAIIGWSEEFVEAAAAGDDAKVNELVAEGDRLSEEYSQLAEGYGLQVCSQPEQ